MRAVMSVLLLTLNAQAFGACRLMQDRAILCAAGGMGEGRITTAELFERYGMHFKDATTPYFTQFLMRHQCVIAGRLKTRTLLQMGQPYSIATASGYVNEITGVTDDAVGAAFYVPTAALRGSCDLYRAPVYDSALPPSPMNR